MTEEKFTELINLYLDKEISQKELTDLKAELARDSNRKAEFSERCRLHQAMRMALNPESTKRSRSRHRSRFSNKSSQRHASRSPSRNRSKRGRAVGLSAGMDESAYRRHSRLGLPGWALGSGLAASILFLFIVVPTAFKEKPAEIVGLGTVGLVEGDPLDQIGREELLRFAANKNLRSEDQRASLAAKFRLMGLQPELTPLVKRLRTVSLLALEPQAPQQSQAERLQAVKNLSPIPKPRIFRHDSSMMDSMPAWPESFQSSLATFESE